MSALVLMILLKKLIAFYRLFTMSLINLENNTGA